MPKSFRFRNHTPILPILILLPAILLCMATFSAAAQSSGAIKNNKALLSRLDSLIANHDQIIKGKEENLKRLRREYIKAKAPARKFELARSLYHEYRVYNPDSAMVYANAAIRLANTCFPSDKNRLVACQLDRIFIKATQGFGHEAVEQLEAIDPAGLSPDMKINYFQVGQYIYSSLSLFNDSSNSKTDPWMMKANAFRDSLMHIDPNHLRENLWAPVALQIDNDIADYKVTPQEVALLEKSVENQTESSRENAINAYWLARHYQKTGDDDKMVHYMAMSAIHDAEIENREIAAITELALWLFDHGDLDRAYTYLIYSSDQASNYRNRARVLNVGALLPTVRDAYRDVILQRDRRLHLYVAILIGLSVILLGAVSYIVLENRRLKRTRRALANSNTQLERSLAERDEALRALEEANSALSDANRVLNEADKVKQGLVALSFRLASTYINALDDYRKKLLRKFKAKQLTELGAELNDQDLTRDPYRDFYAAFDHTVLSIFPDFIAEYTAASPADANVDAEQIMKTRTLNTRMRIFALRRLGVDKSAEIAKMLNVSIRTVYNNRS